MNDGELARKIRAIVEGLLTDAEEAFEDPRLGPVALPEAIQRLGLTAEALLLSLFREAREPLERIAGFDVERDTYDGWNEWGEAEAWDFAQMTAKTALGQVEDHCYAMVPVEESDARRWCGHKFAQHGKRWKLSELSYCIGCYHEPPAGDFDHHTFTEREDA